MNPTNALDAPDRVTSLTIHWEEWTTIRPRVKEFKKLKHLTLNSVGVAELPGELADLPALEWIDLLLAGNRLPSGIQVFSSIKKLGLAALRANGGEPALMDLPEALATLRQLERLRIEYASFERFPPVVYDLSSLRELHLLFGRIGEFPMGISKLKRLHWISFGEIALAGLPPDLGMAPALQTVEVDGIPLRTFPLETGHYAALEELTLTNCELSTLPDEVGRLPRLRALTVSGNGLEQIPSALASAKKLQVLSAEGCRLETIPDGLFSLPALQQLNLTANTFPKERYEALERLAKSHPNVKVRMPRSGGRKPPPSTAIADVPLAESIQKDLDRLGAMVADSAERVRKVKIADTAWPVPVALGQLLARLWSRRAILSPFDDGTQRVSLSYQPGALDEHECIHHHPYVVVAETETYFYVVLRIDDEKPADPMLYMIDRQDSRKPEAGEFERLSDWLKAARPAEG